MNQFADKTKGERNQLNGFIPEEEEPKSLAKLEQTASNIVYYVPVDAVGSGSSYVYSSPPNGYVSPFTTATPSDSVDWRSAASPVLTPVKDQGQCGSCWAFTGTTVLESNIAVYSKAAPVRTSEQEYVDCVKGICGGCNGGNAGFAWYYTSQKNGQLLYDDYPYTDASYSNGVTGTCNLPSGKTRTSVKPQPFFARAKSLDATKRMVMRAPIAVSIDASQALMYYSSGVFSGPCSSTSTNHAVTLVGYTSTYWIIQNSWGSDWGEKGFIKIAMGTDGTTCGVLKSPTGLLI